MIAYDRDDPVNWDPPEYEDEGPPERARPWFEILIDISHLPDEVIELWRVAFAFSGQDLDQLIADARAEKALRDRGV